MLSEFYVGTYASEKEEGILRFSVDTDTGAFTKLSCFRGIYDPSYLCMNKEKNLLYAVQEQVPAGAVHTLEIREGGLEHVKACPSGGADPCHLSLDKEKNYLYAANYSSGSLAVLALDQEGIPAGMCDLKQHAGSGADPRRQEQAHIHFSKEKEGVLFVTDLGMDRVFTYKQNRTSKKLDKEKEPISLPPGFGPRHLAFHEKHRDMLYVLCELASKVVVLKKNQEGEYRICQEAGTLPVDFAGENTAAAVKISGEYLLASNRGHDSIAVFRIRQAGDLLPCGIFSSGGRTPRDLEVFGDWVVAANQDSDMLAVLKLNRETGELTLTGNRAEAVKPCCVYKI